VATFGSGLINAENIGDNSITNAKMADDAIKNAEVASDAAIAFPKLASLTSGNLIVGSAANVPTAVAMSGDVTIVAAGTTAIGALKVTNAMLATPSLVHKVSGQKTVQASTATYDIDFIDVAFSAAELVATDIIVIELWHENKQTSKNMEYRIDLEATTADPTGTQVEFTTNINQFGYARMVMVQSATASNTDVVNVFDLHFQTGDIAPVALVVKLDSNDAAIFTTAFSVRLNFKWSAAAGEEPVHYKVMVEKSS